MENGKKKKKKIWKLLLIIGVPILIIIFVVANLTQSRNGTTEVVTKKVVDNDIVAQVSGSGKIQPKTSVNVTSQVSAEVVAIPVKEGDRVRKGDLLLQLDTVQLKRDLESYLYSYNELMARLEGSKVMLDQSANDYQIQKGLYDKSKDLTSEKAYKDSYFVYKNQEAGVKAMEQQANAANARLEKARELLRYTTIRSVMDGVVTLVDVEVGEIAQAQTAYSAGRTLMVVSDLSEFEVEVEIDETDIADLDMGQKASIEVDAFPDTTFEGRVVEIGNTATTSGFGTNDQETNFKVKVALVDAPSKIRPGMSSTVDITTQEKNGVPTTLIQAIVMREFDPDSLENVEKAQVDTGGESGSVAVAAETPAPDEDKDKAEKEKVQKKGVFVVREGKAHFVEIETGIADQQNIEIVKGPEVGDEVITGSFHVLRTIKEGDPVKVNNSKFNRN